MCRPADFPPYDDITPPCLCEGYGPARAIEGSRALEGSIDTGTPETGGSVALPPEDNAQEGCGLHEECDMEPCTYVDAHADGRDLRRRNRKVLDNRRSVFLMERLSREPSRRRQRRGRA